MGTDSSFLLALLSPFVAEFLAVSPLFPDVVQCLGTPLLEIKKSQSSSMFHTKLTPILFS